MGCGKVILLDTHAFIWFVDNPSMLNKKTLSLIDSNINTGRVFVSCISTWEILTLAEKGRIEFSIPADVWIERCEKTDLFQFIPIDNTICRISTSLGLHGDPADRFIAATSVYLGATLITKDRKLRQSKKVKTIW